MVVGVFVHQKKSQRGKNKQSSYYRKTGVPMIGGHRFIIRLELEDKLMYVYR